MQSLRYMSSSSAIDCSHSVLCQQQQQQEEASSTAMSSSSSSSALSIDAASSSSAAETTIMDDVSSFMLSATEAVVPPPAAEAGFHWPSLYVQDFINYIHVTADVPWFVAIGGATIMVRMLLFPVAVMQHRSTARMTNARPEMKKIEEQIQEMKASGNLTTEKRMEVAHRQAAIFKKHKINMLAFLMPFTQMPIFVSFFFGCRALADRFPDISSGGYAWFLDLSQQDPYWVLPITSAISMLLTIEVGSVGNPNSATSDRMKMFMRFFSIMIIPATASFPAAVHTYWVSSNVTSLLQTAFLKIPFVRSLLDIPKILSEKEHQELRRQVPKVEVVKPVTYSSPPTSSTGKNRK